MKTLYIAPYGTMLKDHEVSPSYNPLDVDLILVEDNSGNANELGELILSWQACEKENEELKAKLAVLERMLARAHEIAITES